MSDLTFTRLANANQNRLPDYDRAFPDADGSFKHWTLLEWAGATCGEAGELANKCKKRRRGQHITDDEISDEAADVVIYLDLLCQKLGVSLGDAIVRKFNARSCEINSEVRL